MNIVKLKSDEFSNADELHLLLKERLKLPDHYGKNLDALWDCLTGWIKLPTTIEWINFEKSKQNVGEYADRLASVFEEAENEMDGFKFIKK
jgi:ribonuclease inhibitor